MTKRRSLRSATRNGDEREQLETLAYKLARAIDENKGHGMASLAREYRETVRAIADLGGEEVVDDPIGRIVSSHGPSGADILKFAQL